MKDVLCVIAQSEPYEAVVTVHERSDGRYVFQIDGASGTGDYRTPGKALGSGCLAAFGMMEERRERRRKQLERMELTMRFQREQIARQMYLQQRAWRGWHR